MRFAIDSQPIPEAATDGHIGFRQTDNYIEAALPAGDGFFVLYYLPRSASSWWLMACVSPYLDPLNSPMNDATKADILRTWSVLAELLENAQADLYSEGALLRMNDPDTDEVKWFVSTFVEGISAETPEQLFQDVRAKYAAQVVIERTLAMLTELKEKDLATGATQSFWGDVKENIWQGLKEGFWQGVRERVRKGVKQFVDEYRSPKRQASQSTSESNYTPLVHPKTFRVFETLRRKS